MIASRMAREARDERLFWVSPALPILPSAPATGRRGVPRGMTHIVRAGYKRWSR